MMRRLVLAVLFLLSASAVYASCSSGSLGTGINKQYQMAYPDEDFLQVSNIDLVKDISQLKDLTCLQYMDASDRTIKGDISNLKNLRSLVYFSLYSNPDVYGDICSLSGSTGLRTIKFAFDPKIKGDVSCLKSLTKLESFAMTHTQISGDISVFANMPNLKAIYISGTNIRGDICSLSRLTNLEELGIADEYPGNPDIYGDLSCLGNLKKLTRVSLYNTNATNCEQFTADHPNIEQGGCSKESLKTLVDYAQRFEEKIGKVTQTEVRGQPNYQPDEDNYVANDKPKDNFVTDDKPKDNDDKIKDSFSQDAEQEEPKHGFFARFFGWVRVLFSKGKINSGPDGCSSKEECDSSCRDCDKAVSKERPIGIENGEHIGPGGCKSQSECDAFCQNPQNRQTCDSFDNANGISKESQEEGIQSDVRVGPGGCKSKAECDAFCKNNRDICDNFDKGDENFQQKPEQQSALTCRVSILPSSKGTAPYEGKVCIDNPNERVQQPYKDYVDFDGDGTWDDLDQKHGCHSHYYNKGTFSPRAKIVDENGKESEVCQATVVVS